MTSKINKYHNQLQNNLTFFAKKALVIKDKESGKISPFIFNKAQEYLHGRIEDQLKRKGRVRVIILKGRQQGCSTYAAARFYHKSTRNKGKAVFILSHEYQTTTKLFAMVDRFQQNCPDAIKPHTGTYNNKQIKFDLLDSEYTTGTAGNEDVGRGGTLQYLHGCLAEGTQVVSAEGPLKSIESLNLGDLIVTHTGKTAPISFISSQAKPCLQFIFKGLQKFPLIATPDHKVFTKKGFVSLGQLNVGDHIGYPVKTINQSITSQVFGLPEMPRPQGGGSREDIPNSLQLDYDLGRVIGLYLAEGVITKQWKTGVYSSTEFAVHEKEVGRTKQWLSLCSYYFNSVKVQTRKDSKTCVVIAYGKSFAAFVDGFCGRTDQKRLPACWSDFTRPFLKGVLIGYLSGDGHVEKATRRISAPSIRSAITIQMRDITASLGYGWASINYIPAGFRNGRNEQEQFVYRLTGTGVDALATDLGEETAERRRVGSFGQTEINDGYAWLPVIDIEEAGEHKVYDLEIDHADHSYCVVQGATHNSEVGFWENTDGIETGIMQSIADVNSTEIILESTANGMGNMFHRKCMAAMRGEGDYELVFIPWFWQTEYSRPIPEGFVCTDAEHKLKEAFNLTSEQILWRRIKIEELGAEWKFRQEYPMTVRDAFVSSGVNLVNADSVTLARKSKITSPQAPLIIGVDAGREKDRSVIMPRRGRQVLPYTVYDPAKEGMIRQTTIASRLEKMIDTMGVSKIFIDNAKGYGIIDILEQDGYGDIIRGVYFSEGSTEPDKYSNKRAEMHIAARDWIETELVNIPDDEELEVDIASIPDYRETTNGLIQIPPKKDIIKILGRSPDLWDALILTFAYPVAKNIGTKHNRIKKIERSSTLVTSKRVNKNRPLSISNNVNLWG